jgi:hypothetical protein
MSEYIKNQSRFLLILISLALLFNLAGCASTDRCSDSGQEPLHILFIGNSYTYVNDLPTTFRKLACSGGIKVETDMAASGGWTLAQHAGSQETFQKIDSRKWDFVVLQEQSEIPAIPNSRIQSMYPAARILVSRIRLKGSKPVFFLTWGHRDGDKQFGIQSYTDMQSQLRAGYLGIAQELSAPVAGVGDVWRQAAQQPDPISLWQDDGSHPTEAGTYLAACVFYAVLFHQSPEGLPYHGNVPENTAGAIQSLSANLTSTISLFHGKPQ